MKLGIVGGGQLSRMLALAAHPLGIRVHALCASLEDPAGRVARAVVESGDRRRDLRTLAEVSDVLTYESESPDVHELRESCASTPIEPALRALELAQDRLLEKRFLRELRIPLADFEPVESRHELEGAAARLGLPAVLKTRRGGYDGKGQARIRDERELEQAWQQLGGRRLVLEELVRFEREVSIVAVRSREGEIRFYPLVENLHAEGILRATIAPAEHVAPRLELQAREQATRILEALDYVGVLAVEFFEREGQLLVNEIAPRVHNSGHWTIEGAVTSQFENHVRAVCGLPLGSTDVRGASVMLNLLGSLPERAALLSIPGAHLHLYDKTAAAGRKLGHLTLCAPERRELAGHVASALEVMGEASRGILLETQLASWTGQAQRRIMRAPASPSPQESNPCPASPRSPPRSRSSSCSAAAPRQSSTTTPRPTSARPATPSATASSRPSTRPASTA